MVDIRHRQESPDEMAVGIATPLPIGARLDRETGVFTWVRRAGYPGSYSFGFKTLNAPFTLIVTVADDKTR